MKIKLSVPENATTIMKIIADAQRFLAAQNIDQWQDGYPTKELISTDIQNKESYLITNDEDEVMATLMFTTRPERSYPHINGEWITKKDATYGVIHRLAVDDNFRKMGCNGQIGC